MATVAGGSARARCACACAAALLCLSLLFTCASSAPLASASNDLAAPASIQGGQSPVSMASTRIAGRVAALASGDVYPVALEDYAADTPGARTIYEMAGDGFYLDAATAHRMTATANPVAAPVRDGYEFGGYWTGENGTGTCFVTPDGFLSDDASSVAFAEGGELYARWYTTAAYEDSDGSVLTVQKVPINVPTDLIDLDEYDYLNRPPADCGWSVYRWIDDEHVDESGDCVAYYEGDKLLIDSPADLDAEFYRTFHCIYYIDGLTMLTKEDTIPLGWWHGQTYDATAWAKERRSWYRQNFTWSSWSSARGVYGADNDAGLQNGWIWMGWATAKQGQTPQTHPCYQYAEERFGGYFPTYYSNEMNPQRFKADAGNYLYAVYERKVPVRIHANGMEGSCPDSFMYQAHTCDGGGFSSKPYGFLGGTAPGREKAGPGTYSSQSDVFSRPGYTYKGVTYGDPDGWSPTDPSTDGNLYNLGDCIRLDPSKNDEFPESATLRNRIGPQGGWLTSAESQTMEFYAQCDVNPVKVSLADDAHLNRAKGTSEIYYKQDIGYFLDAPCTKKMTPSDNPVKVPELSYGEAATFTGWYLQAYGNGGCYIDANGFLTADASVTAFPEGGTLHAAWVVSAACFDGVDTLTLFQTMDGTDEYSSWTAHGTATDILGRTYTGQVFYNVQHSPLPFASVSNDTVHVRIAEGQVVSIGTGLMLFYGFGNLADATGFDRLDVSRCTNMSFMFSGCGKLEQAPDTSTWNTANVTNMANMFWGCKAMASAPDTSRWDVGRVESFWCMFEWCESMAETPDTSRWDTSSCTTMTWMFNNCTSMPAPPDVSAWNTSRVTSMAHMFRWMTSITEPPDVSSWDVSACRDMTGMFYNEEKITRPPDTSRWRCDNVESCEIMFVHCARMAYAPDTSAWGMSKCKSTNQMFFACWAMTDCPDVSAWNTSSLEDATLMFGWCSKLAAAPDLRAWDTSSLKAAAELFWSDSRMPTPKMFSWDYHPAGSDYVDLTGVFYGCAAMSGKLDLGTWDLSRIQGAQSMFYRCSALDEIDISGLDFSGIADVDFLKTVVSAHDSEPSEVHVVGSMDAMFEGCTSLKKIHLGDGFLFYNCDADERGGCILPVTESGYWLNSSHAGSAVVTPSELRDGYDGVGADDSLNAGVYCAAYLAGFHNDTLDMGAQWLPWNTPHALTAIADLANKPALDPGKGWVFAGWATSNDTDEVAYGDAELAIATGAVDFYCVYARPVYFEHYKAATATAPASDTVSQTWRTGTAQPVFTPSMVESSYGWRPLGWHQSSEAAQSTSLTSADLEVGGDSPPQLGTTIPEGSNARWFYGVYRRDCAVSYDRNDTKDRGGRTPGTTTSQFFTAGATASTKPIGTLADNGFSKDDCEFVCWTLGSTGGAEYDEGASVPDDAALGSEQAWATERPSFTMFAKWRALKITFEVPTRVELDVLADGTVLAPSAASTAIENLSPFDIDIVGYRVAPEPTGISLVGHVFAAEEMAVTVQPDGYPALSLVDYVNDAFTRVFWEVAEDGRLDLGFSAEDVMKLDNLGSTPIKLAAMYFKAQAVV